MKVLRSTIILLRISSKHTLRDLRQTAVTVLMCNVLFAGNNARNASEMKLNDASRSPFTAVECTRLHVREAGREKFRTYVFVRNIAKLIAKSLSERWDS